MADNPGKPIERGDLRWAVSPQTDRSRVVLVRSVHPGSGQDTDYCTVMLGHSWGSELLTEADRVFTSEYTGAPFAVTIQTDLFGCVFTHQLGPVVGRIEDASHSTAPMVAPLAGPNDPRWRFKAEEGAEFRMLTGNCDDALFAEEQNDQKE